MAAPSVTPAGEAGTLSSLRTLLDVAAVVRSRDDLQRLLEAIATTVAQALGFAAVVVNLYRPAWDDYEVVVVEGDDAAARDALMGEHVDPQQLAGCSTTASAATAPTWSRTTSSTSRAPA